MADLVLRINRALMIRPVEYEYIGVRAVVMVTQGCNAHTPQGCCPDLAPILEDLISYATFSGRGSNTCSRGTIRVSGPILLNVCDLLMSLGRILSSSFAQRGWPFQNQRSKYPFAAKYTTIRVMCLKSTHGSASSASCSLARQYAS